MRTAPTPTTAVASQGPSQPAQPARQRRKQTRPQELLDAALRLFVEKGFAATRAAEVARAAGVSKGTLYVYYPSKEELFKAVVRQNLSSLIAEGFAMAEQHAGSISALLVTLLTTWWKRVGDTPAAGIHKVVLSEVGNFPDLAQFYADEVIAPADRLFSETVQRGIDNGEFRALPVHAAAHALLAPMIFHAIQHHSLGACALLRANPIAPADVLRTQIDILLRGLQVRADDPCQAARAAAPASARSPASTTAPASPASPASTTAPATPTARQSP